MSARAETLLGVAARAFHMLSDGDVSGAGAVDEIMDQAARNAADAGYGSEDDEVVVLEMLSYILSAAIANARRGGQS